MSLRCGQGEGRVARRGQVGGPIALVKNGDTIRIDVEKRVMDVLNVTDAEWAARRAQFVAPPLKATSGTLYKCARARLCAPSGPAWGEVTPLGCWRGSRRGRPVPRSCVAQTSRTCPTPRWAA